MKQTYIKVISIHLYYKNIRNVNCVFPKLLLPMELRHLVKCFIGTTYKSLRTAELEDCATQEYAKRMFRDPDLWDWYAVTDPISECIRDEAVRTLARCTNTISWSSLASAGHNSLFQTLIYSLFLIISHFILRYIIQVFEFYLFYTDICGKATWTKNV